MGHGRVVVQTSAHIQPLLTLSAHFYTTPNFAIYPPYFNPYVTQRTDHWRVIVTTAPSAAIDMSLLLISTLIRVNCNRKIKYVLDLRVAHRFKVHTSRR